MKRIVLCFDGTWNKPGDDGLPEDQRVETNVRRFFESVHSVGQDGIAQLAWYNPGVGVSWVNKIAGGAFGAFLDEHILDGYRQLVEQYNDGDEIYIVGFSRGAYAARSLVGMLRNCGLVSPGFGLMKIATAYGIYRTRRDPVDSEVAVAFRRQFSRELSIKFLGVWDTVGALGIPLHIANQIDRDLYEFHDTNLSSIVKNAFQAIALDEHRQDYDICLWSPEEPADQILEQRWFCGAHCDVGGGYPSRKLSDLTLLWMQIKAAKCGLSLDPVSVSADNFLGESTDSYHAFLGGAYSGRYRVYVVPAQIPALGFAQNIPVVGVPSVPTRFNGIAAFRFLNRFTYGNFGDPGQFGLER